MVYHIPTIFDIKNMINNKKKSNFDSHHRVKTCENIYELYEIKNFYKNGIKENILK